LVAFPADRAILFVRVAEDDERTDRDTDHEHSNETDTDWLGQM
jgi:hypothetical protein